MSYKIRIEQTREARRIKPKEWTVIKRGPPDDQHPNGEPIYGYAPEVETLIAERRTVLEQEVDDMDLVRVIKAINGIE